MTKWNVCVMLSGYVNVEVEADSYGEACAEAIEIVDEDMVDGWDYDIDCCERDDD